MKLHERKKAFRKMMQKLAKDGYANLPDGRMVPRAQLADTSMKRDYYPQR